MWTDGRYYLQANNQLYEGWELMKFEKDVDRYFDWVTKNMPKGSKIGVDATQIGANNFKTRKEFFEKNGYEFVS